MAKRELIDRNHLLEEIKKLQKSPWYNLGKDNMVVSRALYNERKEAVEVVRDLCVNDESTITEQEIVKPYLEKLKTEVEKKHTKAKQRGSVLQMNAYTDCLQMIDNLLSEQETK